MEKGERLNTITHLAGAAGALVGMAILVAHAGLQGDPWKIVSFSVYCVTLLVLYLFSTLYHGLRGVAKHVFQKLDHAAIYLLIAGTYTPFALVTLRGRGGWIIFGIIWGLAIFGVLQDVLFTKRRSVLSVCLYILMGWFALVVIRPLAKVFPVPGLILVVSGGILYTVGIIFYVLGKRWRHGHGIFHFFVLGGSLCHYLSIFLYIA